MHNSKASLFLMELMVVILFFSISSAVYVQLFMKGHQINNTTQDLSTANIIAQNISECFLSCDGSMEQTLHFLDEFEQSQNVVYSYYDNMGNVCTKDSSKYIEVLTFSDDDKYNYMDIQIVTASDNKSIYQFTMKKYRKETLK